jgi:hypothetical protein
LHVFSHMWKTDLKDKHINKYKHDRVYVCVCMCVCNKGTV